MKRWSWMQTRQTKSSFQGPKSYRNFRETGPALGLREGVKSGLFWSEIWSGFWEPCGTPYQEFPGVPPGSQGAVFSGYFYFCEYLTEEITATLDIQCETFIRMLQSVIWCRCILVTSMLIPYHARYEKQLKTNHVNWPKNVARNPGKGIKDWKNIKHWITCYIDCLKQNGSK